MDTGFVYKWYDTSNDMYYIGSHKGSVDDGYVGSGKYFLRAYNKRKDCFVREILYTGEHYRIYEDTILKYLNAEKDEKSYNLKNSAVGGWSHLQTEEIRKHRGQKISKSLKGRAFTKDWKKNISKSKMKKVYSKSDNILFESFNDAAQYYNVSRNVISNMVNGKTINIYKLEIAKEKQETKEHA